MTPYNHMPGYLHRWRLFGLGRLMVRLHRILSPDNTPFLHTHPFAYVSIVLRGGYTERVLRPDGILATVTHRRGSVIVRGPGAAHRIDAVEPGCKTLFFAWRVAGQHQAWELQKHPDVHAPAGYWDAPDGLYRTKAGGWRARIDGCWLVERPTALSALDAGWRLSIHQDVKKEDVQRIGWWTP